MATISYVLRDAYATNYVGANISVGSSRTYNVGQGLIDGGGSVSGSGAIVGGTITIDAADQPLVNALDGYAGVRRSGSSDVGVAAATTRTGPLVVSRQEPVGSTAGAVPVLQADGSWVATPGGSGASLSANNLFTGTKGLAWHAANGNAIIAKALGDGTPGIWDVTNDDTTGYIFHLHSGPNSGGAAYSIGWGGDAGSGGGALFSQKADGPGVTVLSHPSASGAPGLKTSGYSAVAVPLRVDSYVGSPGAQIVAQPGQGFPDGISNGTTTFTSATANFVVGDEGKAITQLTSKGEGLVIPAGTTIVTRVSATTVTLSAAVPNTSTPGMPINFLIAGRAASSAGNHNLLSFYDDTTQVGKFTRASFSWRLPLEVSPLGSNPNSVYIDGNSVRNYAYNSTNTDYLRSDLVADAFGMRIVNYAHAAKGSESAPTEAFRTAFGPKIGFLGATPVVRQTLPASGVVTAADIRSLLITIGLAV